MVKELGCSAMEGYKSYTSKSIAASISRKSNLAHDASIGWLQHAQAEHCRQHATTWDPRATYLQEPQHIKLAVAVHDHNVLYMCTTQAVQCSHTPYMSHISYCMPPRQPARLVG